MGCCIICIRRFIIANHDFFRHILHFYSGINHIYAYVISCFIFDFWRVQFLASSASKAHVHPHPPPLFCIACSSFSCSFHRFQHHILSSPHYIFFLPFVSLFLRISFRTSSSYSPYFSTFLVQLLSPLAIWQLRVAFFRIIVLFWQDEEKRSYFWVVHRVYLFAKKSSFIRMKFFNLASTEICSALISDYQLYNCLVTSLITLRSNTS